MGVLSIVSEDANRLIGELKHDMRIVLDALMISYILPNPDEIFLIVIANLYLFRTYSWWAHHDIDAITNGMLRYIEEYSVKILLEHDGIEGRDVALSIDLYALLIAPKRIHVDANPVDFPSFFKHGRNLSLIPISAFRSVMLRVPVPFYASISILAPSITIEIRTVSLSETMKIDNAVIAIHILCHEVTSLNEELGHTHSLPSSYSKGRNRCQHCADK